MNHSIRLRPWQKHALEQFSALDAPDFLAVATPGAGKTTFALTAARLVLASGDVRRLVVVVPTAHLKRQWARAAARLDLHLETAWSPSLAVLPADMHGIVTTYQQVATHPAAVARLARGGFVVLDEVHHAGDDRAWGESLRRAFSGATRRLSLSGTPFRSDSAAIPFVEYRYDEAQPDFEYDYGEALSDRGVVRPIYFPRTNGFMEWQAPDGTAHAATFDDPLATTHANQRLRTALSAEGQWLPEVLAAAHGRLLGLRQRHPEAGGLVIATDQEHARRVAELLRRNHRVTAVVATSDDPMASLRISHFGESRDPWLVAVRMVSEGVDLPRLRVGVFATTTTTDLFFRQAVGRFVRWTPGVGRQPAYLYIPDDPRLRRAADEVAQRRRHNLRRPTSESAELPPEDPLVAELRGEQETEEQLSLFSVISAVATDAVIPDDKVDDDEPLAVDDDPSLVLDLPSPPPLGGRPVAAVPDGVGRAETKQRLRRANQDVARAIARRSGRSHAEVNAELNRLAGVTTVAAATLEQLERRLRHGEAWSRKG